MARVLPRNSTKIVEIVEIWWDEKQEVYYLPQYKDQPPPNYHDCDAWLHTSQLHNYQHLIAKFNKERREMRNFQREFILKYRY